MVQEYSNISIIITVDAYRSALFFYEKNEFCYLTTKDIEEDTLIKILWHIASHIKICIFVASL